MRYCSLESSSGISSRRGRPIDFVVVWPAAGHSQQHGRQQWQQKASWIVMILLGHGRISHERLPPDAQMREAIAAWKAAAATAGDGQ
jgi:hypothetical protein